MAEITFARYFFDTIDAAAAGLLTVLLDARETEAFYRFGGLSAAQVLSSGLSLSGDLTQVTAKLDKLPGAVRHDE